MAHYVNGKLAVLVPPREWLDEVKRSLSYDPMTGEILWLVTRGAAKAGTKAGGLTPKGYVIINMRGRWVRGHQLAWFFMTDEWPTLEMDHKNGVRHDNRWENLRLATPKQNQLNRRPQSASGFKGVYAAKGRWVALIGRKYLGLFETAEDAARAYDRAAYERDPEFSYLNFPLAA